MMIAHPPVTQLEQNKTLIRNFVSQLDSGNRDVTKEVYAPDVVFHFPGSPPLDRDATLELMNKFYTAFPDLTHHIDDLIGEEDKVVLRTTDHATHKGEFEGIAPTGKEVTITGIGVFRIADGKIVEMWEEVDMLGLMQQLGAEVR